jgi:hypothetical protein
VKKSKSKKKPDTLAQLDRKRDAALDRVLAAWIKKDAPDQDPDELNMALDALTLAHAAATFEFVSGSMS